MNQSLKRIKELYDETVSKLAEYEDTGLTPEQIKEIDKAYTEQAKELAELKNKGWIPVEERLPKERGTHIKNKLFDKISDMVLVTVANSKGQITTTHAHTVDGNWKCDLLSFFGDWRITAWMPLPNPYRDEDNE